MGNSESDSCCGCDSHSTISGQNLVTMDLSEKASLPDRSRIDSYRIRPKFKLDPNVKKQMESIEASKEKRDSRISVLEEPFEGFQESPMLKKQKKAEYKIYINDKSHHDRDSSRNNPELEQSPPKPKLIRKKSQTHPQDHIPKERQDKARKDTDEMVFEDSEFQQAGELDESRTSIAYVRKTKTCPNMSFVL